MKVKSERRKGSKSELSGSSISLILLKCVPKWIRTFHLEPNEPIPGHRGRERRREEGKESKVGEMEEERKIGEERGREGDVK